MRAPFQVIVFPYRRAGNEIEVLIGQRSDDGSWQAISGGGEDQESPIEAAKRELSEESGMIGTNWLQLDSKVMLPKIFYKGHEHWGGNVYVIPEFAFATEVTGTAVNSEEHSELRWVSTVTADTLLRYDSNKIALWELCQRVNL
ncbi:NUDIX hydrolase [Catenovulum sediminis]|uniref:NUDIX pyrophosphatase n=1 Tax=Catenovulum sediminis TaxID=1740262 RepID=A0ABV1RLP6_9ALTE|nr:NUDIX pyrophosphatase [Catenovulum sediminis]